MIQRTRFQIKNLKRTNFYDETVSLVQQMRLFKPLDKTSRNLKKN